MVWVCLKTGTHRWCSAMAPAVDVEAFFLNITCWPPWACHVSWKLWELWGWLLAQADITCGKHVQQKRNHPQILGIDATILNLRSMALGLPCPESISSLRDHLSSAASALRPTARPHIGGDRSWPLCMSNSVWWWVMITPYYCIITELRNHGPLNFIQPSRTVFIPGKP